MLRVLSVVAALVVLQLHQTSILTAAVSIVAAAPPPPLHYSFASPGDVRFVRTLFGDSIFGFRDPSAPVFDGHHWHIWATRINGTAAGYGGVVWHLYSEVLDAPWRDGGIAVDRSSGTAWDSCGVFTPSVAWEGAGGAAVPAPQATAWFLFFGGVSHPQGPVFDESIGIATASSPFGPWTKLGANPIITGRDPNVPWCDVDGPGAHPGILHVDEAEPYVLHGERRLYVKTVCRNHTVLPSVFIPRNGSSWMPPYDYDTLIHQPVIAASTVTPSAKVRKRTRRPFAPFVYTNYQDRLGTNIGKALNKGRVYAGVRAGPALPRPGPTAASHRHGL